MQTTCKRCNRPIHRVTLAPTRMLIELDTTPSFDGRYRLSGTDNNLAEPITRPGLQGYQKHDETCTAR
jgi:hypothetical protein